MYFYSFITHVLYSYYSKIIVLESEYYCYYNISNLTGARTKSKNDISEYYLYFYALYIIYQFSRRTFAWKWKVTTVCFIVMQEGLC